MTRLFRAEESQKQIANIDGLINKKHIELEKVTANFKLEVAQMESIYAERKQIFIQEILSLQNEVKMLEDRRMLALKPLDEYKNDLDIRESVLQTLETKISGVNLALDDKERDLIIRLEGVEELSSTLHNKYEEHKIKQEKCQSREERIKVLEDKYAKEVLEFSKKEAIFNEKMAKFDSEIYGKNSVIEAERRHIDVEKKEIIKIKAQLADQRATLERAMKRL